MKRFRFSLERVLSLREKQEGQARLELAAAAARIAECDAAIRALRERYATLRGEVDLRLGEGEASPRQLAQAVAHLRGLELRIVREEERRAALEEERAKRETEYREVRRARRMLEKLRERRLHRHRRESVREEAARFDEIAGRRAYRVRVSRETERGSTEREESGA